jgi:hypothetical protein
MTSYIKIDHTKIDEKSIYQFNNVDDDLVKIKDKFYYRCKHKYESLQCKRIARYSKNGYNVCITHKN